MIDGLELRVRRIRLGFTQKDVAQLFGVSLMTVCRWESGQIGLGAEAETALATLEADFKAFVEKIVDRYEPTAVDGVVVIPGVLDVEGVKAWPVDVVNVAIAQAREELVARGLAVRVSGFWKNHAPSEHSWKEVKPLKRKVEVGERD